MLCQVCQKNEATVHLTTTSYAPVADATPGPERNEHFCGQCADAYFAATPGMNSMRNLICLSDSLPFQAV